MAKRKGKEKGKNKFAIASLVLALMGGLLFFLADDSMVEMILLFALPVVAIIMGAVALKQIKKSKTWPYKTYLGWNNRKTKT